MIYHFCNESFGVPFAAESEAFSRTSGVPITLVYEERGLSARGRIRRTVGDGIARVRTPRVRRLYVADVNSEAFRARVHPKDVGIVTGFGQIFRDATIDRFHRLVNLHPSILPSYRGPVPTHWCIERGETQTGYTLHEITSRIDDGPILFQETVPIDPEDTALSLARRIGDAAMPAFRRYLAYLAEDGEWQRSFVDHERVYRNAVGYRSHT